ncbi:MAG: hypothetical protein CMH15_07460 [Mesonia sp.]|nr:hypothetical protein [Mesonia sp.]MAQ40873.1 hypothetical protein [Mesonia sp.]|tara:strand:- start:8764 stop:9444 length:681 start_codon:yes stop_codon:yes gene_type:complete
MKNMKTIILISVWLSCSMYIQAQQTPVPPTNTSTTSSSSSSYSHNVQKDDQENSNLSIAVSDSEDSYKFRASYSENFDAQVKEILVNRFGKENISKRDSWFSWIFSPENKEVYEIELSSGKVRMKLDKTQADQQLQKKFKRTGEVLKELLSGKEVNRKQLALERKSLRLQREAERMKSEAQRLKREEQRKDRLKQRNEVAELRKGAEELQKQVDSLQQEIEKLRKN